METFEDIPAIRAKLRETIARQCGRAPSSASFQVLKQALADYAFEGGEVACFGDYAVSWNTRENLVAIANSGGWWTMPAADLKAIAAATPTAKESNEDALNRATREIGSWVKSRRKPTAKLRDATLARTEHRNHSTADASGVGSSNS